MKNLNEYVEYLNEGRRPGSKNKPKDPPVATGIDSTGRSTLLTKKDIPSLDDIKGNTPEKNLDLGLGNIGVEEPTDNDVLKDEDYDISDDAKDELFHRLRRGQPFFIQGEAGWGKTSVIKSMAKKFRYTIITVYLDDADETDLGGIPSGIASKDDTDIRPAIVPPLWVYYIEHHPEKKFLLFFDEFNQANANVQNTCMRIVLDHVVAGRKLPNITVGAAGNYDSENDALTSLSTPLKSRFIGVIKWTVPGEDKTAKWAETAEYLHGKWDKKFGTPDVVNVIMKEANNLFTNPRDVERLIETVYDDSQQSDAEKKHYQIKTILNFARHILDENKLAQGRHENDFKQLVQSLYNYIITGQIGGNTRRRASGSYTQEGLKWVAGIIKDGAIEDDVKTYGVSRENADEWKQYLIKEGMDEFGMSKDRCSAEVINNLWKAAVTAADGYKFDTNSEFPDDFVKSPFD